MNNLAASAPVDICIGKRISRRPWDSCCCLRDHFVYWLFVDIENMVSRKLFVTIRARTGVQAHTSIHTDMDQMHGLNWLKGNTTRPKYELCRVHRQRRRQPCRRCTILIGL